MTFTWVDADYLAEHDQIFLPQWIAPRGDYLAMMQINGSKAFRHGLRSRPLAETAADTLEWFNRLPWDRRKETQAGLAPDVERELLEGYRPR